MEVTKKAARARVSVVLPTRDRARFLPLSIRSVLDQGIEGLEVLVIDDGSTDGTPAVAASFGDRIRYVRQEGAGPSAARNRGLSLATGELVAFQDSDDLWLPGRLARQIPMLEAAPRAGLLYGAVGYVDEDGNPGPVRPSRRGTPSGWILPHLLRHNVIQSTTVLARRAVVEEAGGFDARLTWCEDYDLWLRMAVRHEAIYDPEPTTLIRRHRSQLSADRAALADAGIAVLEGNLARLSREAPEHAPRAARALAGVRLRRADRRFRDGDREGAEAEIGRALELAPGLRWRALAMRLRVMVRRVGRGG